MTKILPTQDIANELKDSSVFFQRPEPSLSAPNAPVAEPTSMEDTPRSSAVSRPVSPQAEIAQPLATNERSNEQTKQRTNERTKVRHSFDVFQDQLASLRKIQLVREEAMGKRYLFGELVQEALDLFISNERNNNQPFVPTK